jgi:hypothetical protein
MVYLRTTAVKEAKMRLYTGAILLTVVFLAATANPGCGVESASPELHVGEFGINEGQPVERGFVFYDGRYLPTPYTVTRRGTAVAINGIVVTRPRKWPLPDLAVDQDPGVPEWVTEDTPWNDLVDPENRHNGVLARKARYLAQHHPDEYVERMIEFIRSLPNVQSLEEKRAPAYVVRTKDGKTETIGIMTPTPDSYSVRSPTKEEVTEDVNKVREYYEKWLQRGDMLMFDSSYHDILISEQRVCRDLPVILDIAQSNRPLDEKMGLLTRVEFAAEGDPAVEALARNFKGSVALRQRLSEVCTGKNVVPRRIKDLPEETYLQKQERLRKEAPVEGATE